MWVVPLAFLNSQQMLSGLGAQHLTGLALYATFTIKLNPESR